MYTMTGYKIVGVYVPSSDLEEGEALNTFNGDWIDEEKVDFELTDVIGYSFGTHSVAAQFADGSAEIRFTDGLSRILLSAPKREEEPAKAANEETAAVPDNVVSLVPTPASAE